MRRLMTALLGLLGGLGLASAAFAELPSYPDPGTPNPGSYIFTATNDGPIVAYFAGSGASDDEVLGLLVNGVAQGGTGLDDHSSTVGQSWSFGDVSTNDILTFFIIDNSTQSTWYSDPTLNHDGPGGGPFQHIWSTPYAGGDDGIPAGTYVAFEDRPFGASDLNYHDETFVFTNVSTNGVPGGVPEPATWGLMLLGFGGLGATLRRRRADLAAA